MRVVPFFLLLLAAAPALAAPPSAPAQLYAERTALLAGDGQCHLLTPDIRTALIATTAQARFGALRAGWTAASLDGVAQRAADSGRARPCADAALRLAARNASQGYRGWSKLPAMTFPGPAHQWSARRVPDLDGWTLSQDLAGGAKFGLAADALGHVQLVLALPADTAPTIANLYLRDASRAPEPLIDVPGLAPQAGLAGGLAPRSLETARFASQRLVYRPKNAPARVLFVFPANVLAEIAALDPRETVEIEISSAGAPVRLLVEVGDLAAAQAFLAAKST